MAKDTSSKSREDLQRELAETEERLNALKKEEAEYDDKRKAELRAKWKDEAAAEGYTLAEVVGDPAPKGKGKTGRSKGTAKYRDPASGKTWTGKGRQPDWVKDHVATGGSKEDFAI